MFHVSRAFAWLNASRDFSAANFVESVRDINLSRRQILAGAAATTVSAMIPAGVAGNLRITSSRDQIFVELEERAWVIDRAIFGAAARLRYREDGGTHFISVDRSPLAGLSRRADFDATLQIIAGQWRLALRIFDATFDIPFLAWLQGKHAARAANNWYFAARRAGSQTAYLECMSRSAEIEISPRWQVRLRADTPLVSLGMDGLLLQSSDVQLTLGAQRRASALDLVNIPAATATATFDLLDASIATGTASPGQVGSEVLTLTFDALKSAQATIALQQDGSQQAILSLVGEAAVDVSTRSGDVPSVLSGLRLAPAGFVASVFRKSEQRLLVATVAQAAHEVDTPNVVMSVAGTDSSRIAAVFENGLSAPIEVETEIYSAAVPVAGADIARIQFAPMPLDLVIGRALPKSDVLDANVRLSAYRARANSLPYVQAAAEGPEAACVEKSKTRGLLVAGPTPYFMAPLEQNTWLQVLRSQDLLSLKFGFRNFSIEVRNGRAELVPRSLPDKFFDGAKFDHRLLVEFPPQHVAEEAIRTQLGIGSTPAKNLNFHDRTVPPTSGIHDTPEDSFPPVVKARLSGPTRLVFREKDPVRKALSVRTLTDWKGLAQVVSERAMRTDTPLDKQLQVVGIDKSTSRAEALVKIIQSIRPPRDDETAIEFPYRLILSPDERAQWITPQHPLGALNTPTLLWNARLNRSKGGQSVRAVWARDILLDFLRGNLPVENVEKRDESNEPPFVQSLSRSDRRELVTLSSVYGLPALQRVVLDKDKALNNAVNPGSPTPIPSTKDPAGGVQPFPKDIGLWKYSGNDRVHVPDEGIYVPKPLAVADLSLTAMGATFVGEGQWEPPSPIVSPFDVNLPDIDHNWRPSLRLERWNHRAVLGRDIYVEVAYKGFLFPIGHRASLLKVSERRFFPHPETKKPTAYLIQRLFIVVGKREKNFPALGQPFDGRPWPAHLVTMAAGRTPDLKDPEERGNQQVNGRLLFNDATGAPLNGLVFWPRIAACGDATKLGSDGNIIAADKKEVAFQFRKDEDTQPISAPLLFIDNVAAHEPSTMQAVLDYYRKTLPDGSLLRQATHGSVRRRYAPPVKDGETELDTQSWDLSATGRYVAADATKGVAESFAVDGMMEGADQPPFYPVIRTTNIKVQSVDRMIGTPAGSMTAAFNESYVRHGFAPDQNPSELFLDVLSPAIYLNFAGAGDAVGGLAKPNARLVALSRKFGPVGGKAPPPPSQTSGAFGLLAGNPSATTPAPIGGLGGLPPRGDYSSFASGVLDPKEFLGGADSLPKLLGIFSLADVLKAVAFTNSGAGAEDKVPKLQETSGFSGIGADLAGQLSNVKDVFKKMADDFIGPPPGSGGIIGDTLKQIETTIQSRLGTNFNWRTLYPRLSAAFDNLRNALDAARTQAKSTTDPAQLGRLIPYGSAVVTAGKALIAEVEAVRDNPMPPLVGDILAKLASEWDNLRRFAQLVINGKGLPKIIDGVKADAAQYFDQFYSDLFQFAAAQTAVETQTLIDLVLSVVPSAPYVFSTAVVENDPGEGKLALNNGVQKDATVIYANLTDGEGNQIASLIDALDGSPLNGLGYLRISDASDDKKWLLFRLKELWSQRNYRKFVVEPTAASGNAPLTKDIVLAYIPYLDFNALDPAAIAKRVANTLLYEVAGEQIVSAYAAVRDLATALSGAIDANARDIGAKLTTVTAKLFDAALAMAQAAEKSGVMANVPNWCDQAMEFVIDVSDKVIGVGDDLSKRVVGISKNAAAIKVPPGAPADIRAKVDQARASLIQAQERLSRCLASLDVHRKQIRAFATQCTRIHHALSLSGKIMVLRRDALAALQDVILQARMIAAAIDEITPAQFKNFATADDDLEDTRNAIYELVNNVTELLQGLTSIKTATSGAGPGTVLARIQANVTMLTGNLTGRLDHYKKEIEGARDEFMAAAGSLQARASQVVLDVERWKDSNGKKPFPPDLAAVGSDVLSYAVKHDRRFAALVLQSTQTFNTAKQQLEGTAVKILGIITTPLLEVHKIAIAGAEKILPLIDKDSAPAETKDRAEFLSAILAPGVVAAFKDLSRIKQDQDSLLAIQQAGTAQAAFDAAFAIKDRWSGQDPALVRKIEEVSRIVDSLAHGQLSELVNLDGIRALVEEQIKDALLSFIPTKVDLAYDWKTNLQPFANIFEMRNTADDDLTLAVRTSIDLLHPESRSTRVTGTLKGFRVHILGKSSGSGENSVGSFLSIYFNGAEFSSVNGSRPDFKADMDDVKIGPALEFIRQLGQYLSYSGGGFYVRLTLSPLGIEAGFEFSEEIISLGAITFFNVGFSISAQLPFQDRDARFRFALASADAPFMVSVLPCYGGGGFFAITSNGREIVQAECSAEFGAIVGLKFGPLAASGRVMAGIYIRQAQGGGAFIKGFVHAVGEGHIACFSVTVNIEVCIVHLPSGAMYGQSSYRFTFKVGFAEIGYGVTATYSIASKGGGGGEGGNHELVAFVRPACVDQIMKEYPSCPLHERKFIRTRVPSKSRHWTKYRERIDLSLLEA